MIFSQWNLNIMGNPRIPKRPWYSNFFTFWRKSGVKESTTYIFVCKWLIFWSPRQDSNLGPID
jgi:hypothetical protein